MLSSSSSASGRTISASCAQHAHANAETLVQSIGRYHTDVIQRMTTENEIAATYRRSTSCLYVGAAVADQNRGRRVDVQRLDCARQHSRLWLAAIAVDAITLHRRVRHVRTVAHV